MSITITVILLLVMLYISNVAASQENGVTRDVVIRKSYTTTTDVKLVTSQRNNVRRPLQHASHAISDADKHTATSLPHSNDVISRGTRISSAVTAKTARKMCNSKKKLLRCYMFYRCNRPHGVCRIDGDCNVGCRCRHGYSGDYCDRSGTTTVTQPPVTPKIATSPTPNYSRPETQKNSHTVTQNNVELSTPIHSTETNVSSVTDANALPITDTNALPVTGTNAVPVTDTKFTNTLPVTETTATRIYETTISSVTEKPVVQVSRPKYTWCGNNHQCFHGTCVPLGNHSHSGSCVCEPESGWTGARCNTRCELHCVNSGVCYHNGTHERCMCLDGRYDGDLCDQKVTTPPPLTVTVTVPVLYVNDTGPVLKM